MKKILLTLTAVTAMTGTAFAADMAPRTYAKAPPPVAVASWTGCYVGGGVNYTMWNQNNTPYDPVTGVQTQLTQTAGGKGWSGIVGVGCDYQFAGPMGQWLVGGFGDYSYGQADGQLGTLGFAIVGNERLQSKWAVGGRIGYLPSSNFLTYFSGGWTEAHFNAVNFTGTAGGAIIDTMGSRNYAGWFLGGGTEYQLGFLPGLTWKTEYRYSDLRSADNLIVSVPGNVALTGLHSHKYTQEVMSSLVYRFNWGGPVVARY